ncbi:MAG: tRNA (adenosine(37)-N6)-threonylcarbamoyltransferase complex ATPase subunit type 1 TsaE [Planctomycetota bacterium]
MLRRHLPSQAATAALAAEIAPSLTTGSVLLLTGQLGCGKTTFVRHLVTELGGSPDQVASPTFALLHWYQTTPPVVHVDAYRLHAAEDLWGIGYHDLAETAIACIEWPERVAEAFVTTHCWRIELEHARGESRQATVFPPFGQALARIPHEQRREKS